MTRPVLIQINVVDHSIDDRHNCVICDVCGWVLALLTLEKGRPGDRGLQCDVVRLKLPS